MKPASLYLSETLIAATAVDGGMGGIVLLCHY